MAAESSDEMLAVLTSMKEERQETVLPAVLYRAVHGVWCRCWRRRWTGGRATAARWTPGPSPTPPPPHSSDRPVTTACCTYQISRPEYCGGYSSVQLVRAAVSLCGTLTFLLLPCVSVQQPDCRLEDDRRVADVGLKPPVGMPARAVGVFPLAARSRCPPPGHRPRPGARLDCRISGARGPRNSGVWNQSAQGDERVEQELGKEPHIRHRRGEVRQVCAGVDHPEPCQGSFLCRGRPQGESKDDSSRGNTLMSK